jgi:hypothetical protein
MSMNSGQLIELRMSSKFESCMTDWFYSSYIEQREIEKGFGKETEWNGREWQDFQSALWETNINSISYSIESSSLGI